MGILERVNFVTLSASNTGVGESGLCDSICNLHHMGDVGDSRFVTPSASLGLERVDCVTVICTSWGMLERADCV